MRTKSNAILAKTGAAILLSVISAGCLSLDDSADDESSSDIARSKPNALPVSLGTAGQFAILAKSGISTVPTSDITGDIGVSPIAATAITGFSLIADSTNVFSTSVQVT